MAKGSHKTPKEKKCRGSSAPIEGRDWVKIGGRKWLREVAEKQGKFIPLEYRDKGGQDFIRERAERAAAAEAKPLPREEAEAVEAEAGEAAEGAEVTVELAEAVEGGEAAEVTVEMAPEEAPEADAEVEATA